MVWQGFKMKPELTTKLFEELKKRELSKEVPRKDISPPSASSIYIYISLQNIVLINQIGSIMQKK